MCKLEIRCGLVADEAIRSIEGDWRPKKCFEALARFTKSTPVETME